MKSLKFWYLFIKFSKKKLLRQILFTIIIFGLFCSILILPNYIVTQEINEYYSHEDNSFIVESQITSNLESIYSFFDYSRDVELDHLNYYTSYLKILVKSINLNNNQTKITLVLEIPCLTNNNNDNSYPIKTNINQNKNSDYFKIPCDHSSEELFNQIINNFEIKNISFVSFYQYQSNNINTIDSFNEEFMGQVNQLNKRFNGYNKFNVNTTRVDVPASHPLLKEEVNMIYDLFRFIQIIVMIFIPYLQFLINKHQINAFENIVKLLSTRGVHSVQTKIIQSFTAIDMTCFIIFIFYLDLFLTSYYMTMINWILISFVLVFSIIIRYYQYYNNYYQGALADDPFLDVNNLKIIIILISINIIIFVIQNTIIGIFDLAIQSLFKITGKIIFNFMLVITIITLFNSITSSNYEDLEKVNNENVNISRYLHKILTLKPSYQTIVNLIAIIIWGTLLLSIVNTNTISQFEDTRTNYYHNFNVEISTDHYPLNFHTNHQNYSEVNSIFPIILERSDTGLTTVFINYSEFNEEFQNGHLPLSDNTYYFSQKSNEVIDIEFLDQFSIEYPNGFITKNIKTISVPKFFTSKFGEKLILAPLNTSSQKLVIPHTTFYSVRDNQISPFVQRMQIQNNQLTVHTTKFDNFNLLINKMKLIINFTILPIVISIIYYALETYLKFYQLLDYYKFSNLKLLKLTLLTLGVRLLKISTLVGILTILGYSVYNSSGGIEFLLDFIVVNIIALELSLILGYIIFSFKF